VSLAGQLWAASAGAAEAALAHPFVRGLADGTLPAAAFEGYVLQDAFFLDAYTRAYAMGVARSPDRAGLEAFADLLAGARAERAQHERRAAARGLDLAAVRPHPATLAYTDFLLGAAGLGELGVLCAAMAPCSRLYAFLGSSLAAAGVADAYREWADTYADPAFEDLAATLERLLDRYAADTPAVRGAYRRAMDLELGFFDAALRPGPGPSAAPGPGPSASTSASIRVAWAPRQ
jgi:thiaminase (transcriptional activator TenA)